MSDQQFLAALLLPTLLPTITVLVGILFNNYRMTDLRTHLDSRIGDQNARIDDLRGHLDNRIDDLRRLMDANTKGIMDKLDSIDRRVTDLEASSHRG
ncbi:MAG: hypothetical protein ACR2NN_17035 [Bryobacteraceae bacterium]